MFAHRLVVSTAFAAALLAGGCAHRHQAHNDGGADEPTTLRVANHNWSDMNIYLLRGSERRRLGTVNSNTVSTFRLPESALMGGADIRLLADPIGSSRTYVSPPLVIAPGQQVEWRLENNISLSTALIRG